MTATQHSTAMDAYASVLLARSARWARGYDRRTGVQYVTFVSSRVTKDGQPIYHKASQIGCTCPGFAYRGACSHQLAVAREAERARELVTRRATYEELMDHHLVDAF